MAKFNFKDFYIKYNGHPLYELNRIEEDDVINVIVQKYETIIFTNKGEVLGDPDFGADLLLLLNETKVSSQFVENTINEQINNYIPEIVANGISYNLQVVFTQDPNNFQDMMFIYFSIADYEVYAQIGTQYGSV